VDLALPGRGTEAKGSVMRGAEHLVADKLAVQNDQKYMTLSGGDLRLHDQNGERALLPQPPGTGDIQAISTGGKHWFVLRDNTIHQLSAEGDDPKKVQSARAWQPTEHAGIPPNAVIEDLRPGHDGRLLAQTNQGEFVKADDNTWAPVAAEPAPRANTHEHFNQLADREPDIMRRGAFKTTVNVMGRNVEGMKREQFAPNSIFQNYLTSHFSPTGAVKVPGDSIQHAWKGRVGLKPIYNEETQVLKDLQALGAKARASTMPPSQPMAARIEELAPHLMSPESSELSELLGWFQDTVKNNLQQTLRELAEDQGALLKNGERDPTYRRRARNNDMFADVVSTLRHNGIARDDGLADMLTTLEGSGFTLESRRTQSLLGGSRKRGDEQALLRARLALDVKVLDQISSAVDIFSKEVKRSGNPDFSGMARDLALLHNDAYEGSDIKRYTDAGFRNYAALETSYDATKNLLKHLRKENHPLKRNLLQGIESRPGENNADITRNLTNALRDLEPRESLKLNRNYGGGVNGGASGPAGAAFLGARGSIDPERTYGMTFTRFDRGLKVVLNREGAVSSTLGFGFGGGKTSPGTTPGDSHENLQTNGFWAAGGLDGKYKYADNTALSFFIRDDELDAFMADLMQTPLHSSKQDATAGLKPMDLLNRGVESEVRTTQKHTFDLDLSANVEGRFNKGQTDAEPVAGFMRFGVGLLASMSLMNGEKERTQGRGSDGLHTDIYSSNRARFLEKGSVTGYARMFSSVFSARPNQSFISGGAPMGISATLAVDNKTGKTYDVRFKDALPVQTADVKSLSESLEKAYPDLSKNPSPSAKTPDLVLQDLKAKYINDQPAENDAQHAALISLKQLDRQNTAASQGSSLMTTMDMVVKHNNVNRVDQAALLKRGIDPIKHLLGLDCNPGNAGHIHDIMSGDPQLNSLLQAMKTSNGTTRAEIKLEVNDDIKQRIEDGALSGRLSDKMLKEMLGNKENLRIKSISVFRAAAKDDSLGIALPFVSYKSGSNLTVERLLGEVTFDYGADQLNPKKVTADGEIADRANPEPALAMAQENAGVFRPA
jgi:hypothetical protein